MADRSRTLLQAAAVVFVLIGLLPLLIFAWTLWSVGAIHTFQGQTGLGLSLAVSLLGFQVFRTMMARISRFVGALSGAADARPADSDPAGPGPSKPAPIEAHTPGIGEIREFGEMANTIASLIWKREAAPHVGHPVVISVSNGARPIEGKLVEVTEDGLLLERDSQPVAVVFRRVSGIERAAIASVTE
jgi:hypothetical protein